MLYRKNIVFLTPRIRSVSGGVCCFADAEYKLGELHLRGGGSMPTIGNAPLSKQDVLLLPRHLRKLYGLYKKYAKTGGKRTSASFAEMEEENEVIDLGELIKFCRDHTILAILGPKAIGAIFRQVNFSDDGVVDDKTRSLNFQEFQLVIRQCLEVPMATYQP